LLRKKSDKTLSFQDENENTDNYIIKPSVSKREEKKVSINYSPSEHKNKNINRSRKYTIKRGKSSEPLQN